MKKQLFLATVAAMALASCTSEEFMGDDTILEQNSNDPILFESNSPRVTRAAGAEAAQILGYSFKVYATKTTEGPTNNDNDDVHSNVFALNTFHETSNNPYWVWYTDNSAGNTKSNTKNWDYVGTSSGTPSPSYGTEGYKVTLTSDQTIKYWDYSAKKYIFTAFKETVTGGTLSNITTTGFTYSGTAAQLAGLFIADKLTISEKNNTPTKPATGVNKIGNIVQFNFRNAATKVRLGIYETIPGYVVKNVNFRPNNSEFPETTTNAILSGSFFGTSPSASGTQTYTVTYGASGIAQLATTGTASSYYFDFGTFASTGNTGIGTTSTAPTWASGSQNYQITLPNNTGGNMILYVDYDLYNTISGETIHITGAKAVVPAMYMTWKSNYAYTYLFKISDNTNGKTGTEGTSPEGLFPITFDALAISTNDNQVGTITTVSTPAITTYQDGSVSDAGITYANANGAIYITVNTGGTLASLTADNIKLYTVEAGTTEADLILGTKTKTEVTTGDNVLSVLSADEKIQGITFAASTSAKFTPAAGTTYAVEFTKDAVAAVYTAVANGTTLTSEKTYYTSDTGAGEFVSNGSQTADGTNYYELTTPAAPAFDQYKIIEVAPAP